MQVPQLGVSAPLTLESLMGGVEPATETKKKKTSKTKEPDVKSTGGFVFYTDGNCKPSRGVGGYGVHGYVYSDKPATRGTGNRAAYPTLEGYFDNTSTGKDMPSGNPPITVLEYVELFGNYGEEATNNIAELTAAIKACQFTLRYVSNSDEVDVKRLLIISDSNMVCEGVTDWAPKWRENNWTKSNGGEIKNQELWETLLTEVDTLKRLEIDVKFQWTKGHNGNLGNEIADKLANRAIVMRRKGIREDLTERYPATGFWSGKVEPPNPFITNSSNWYFNSGTDAVVAEDGSLYYHFGNHGPNIDLGKRIATHTFCILHTTKPEPNLEMIRKEQNSWSANYRGSLVIGDLNQILSGKVLPILQRNGTIFTGYTHRESMTLDEQIILTETQIPALRAYSAISEISILQQHLEHFIKGTGDQINHVYTDITDRLFKVSEKKGKTEIALHKHISMALRSLQDIEIGYRLPGATEDGKAKHHLSFNLDMPDRNMFNRVTEPDTKVFVVTWPAGLRAFKVATIVKSGDNTAIYCAPYANSRLI